MNNILSPLRPFVLSPFRAFVPSRLRVFALSCLLLFAGIGTLRAQNTLYPVELNVQVLPPYTTCLSDYITGNASRLRVVALLRDMNQGNRYRFILRMTVRQGNKILLQTKDNISYSNYDVQAGIPQIIEGSHIQHLLNPNNLTINQTGYQENGYCLPEGAYEIVFQAFDSKSRNLPVSQPASRHVYFSRQEPPFLINPYDGACVQAAGNGVSGVINFSWAESFVSTSLNKLYRLEIYKLPVNDERFSVAGGAYKSMLANGSQKPVFTKDISLNTFYSLQMSAGMLDNIQTGDALENGSRYAWRIQAISERTSLRDEEGKPINNKNSGSYQNNGYSDFFYFDYSPVCFNKDELFKKEEEKPVVPVTRFMSTNKADTLWLDTVKAKVVLATAIWKPEKQYESYLIEYRRSDTLVNPKWSKLHASSQGGELDSTDIKGVERGLTYMVRACGILKIEGNDTTIGKYSRTLTFRLPQEGEPDCENSIPALNSTQPIETLKAGDRIVANGNRVKITKVTQNPDGTFTGEGLVSCPFLEDKASLLVSFENIKVNDAKELMQGTIKTVADETTALYLDLNKGLNRGSSGSGAAMIQTTKIPEVTAITSKEHGTVVNYNGKITVVDENGKTTQVGTKIPDDKQVCLQQNDIDSDVAEIVFHPVSDWNPPFDRHADPFKQMQLLQNYTQFNSGYDVPWIGMTSGGASVIKASISSGNIANPGKVKFICRSASEQFALNSSYNNGEYTISLFGGEAGKRLDIHAIIEGTECSENKTVGKAQVAAFTAKAQKVIMVPVRREKSTIDGMAIEEKLNEIYKPLGKTFTVEVADEFKDDEENGIDLSFLDDGLEVEGSGTWTNETEEMKQLKFLYRQFLESKNDKINDDAAYIFVIEKAENESVQGDMPRGRVIGYIFHDSNEPFADGRLVAHEIGHGLFTLQHTFDPVYGKIAEKSTDNLMDYSNGVNLKYWQWTIIQKPGHVWKFIEKDEDGLARKNNEDLINEIVQKLRCAIQSSVRKVCITKPNTMGGTPYHLKVPGIDMPIVPDIPLKVNWYQEFNLYNTYQKSYQGQFCVFKFADDLAIKVYKSKETEFENYINKPFGNDDFKYIDDLADQGKPILSTVFNSSICVLEQLKTNTLVKLVDELSKKWYLTEGYENLVLNVLRIGNSDNCPMERRKSLYKKFFEYKVFDSFWEDMNDADGLPNFRNFVSELADLYHVVHPIEQAERQKFYNQFNNSANTNTYTGCLTYIWKESPWATDDVEWDQLGYQGLFRFPHSGDYSGNHFLNRNGRPTNYNPTTMIYVHFKYDSGFAPQGEVIAMPAFQLAFLLNKKVEDSRFTIVDWTFNIVSIFTGAAEFRAAHWALKAIYVYSTAEFLINDVFSFEYEEYLKSKGENGKKMAYGLKMLKEANNYREAGIGLNNAIKNLNVKELLDTWGLLYEEGIEKDGIKATEELNKMINKIKESIDYEKSIAY